MAPIEVKKVSLELPVLFPVCGSRQQADFIRDRVGIVDRLYRCWVSSLLVLPTERSVEQMVISF